MVNDVPKPILILYDTDLSNDIAHDIKAKQPSDKFTIELLKSSSRPKNLLNLSSNTHVIFILQTIENAAATEDGGVCVRFFKRRTHPENLLEGKFQYCVLGLGDSNLLLDRQTTKAKDCNQVAQELDLRLEKLGGSRFYEIGMADEREGFPEINPWIEGLWNKFYEN